MVKTGNRFGAKMKISMDNKIFAGSGRRTIIYCENGNYCRGAVGSLKKMDVDLGFKYSSCQRIVWKSSPRGVHRWGGRW
jgi:hypothetical protein